MRHRTLLIAGMIDDQVHLARVIQGSIMRILRAAVAAASPVLWMFNRILPGDA